MIKALFFDIDGTLVSFESHRIPESTLEAVRRVREKGVKVFIATGRSIPFINNLDGLEYDGVISVNGACCIDLEGKKPNECDLRYEGKVIACNTISDEDIERVIEDSKVHPMPIAFTGRDKSIVCNLSSNEDAFDEIFTMLNIPRPKEMPIEEARNMEVLQMVAFFTPEEEERVMREVMTGCASNRWHPYFSDCIAKGINKATGIDDICHYYGFDVEETMAFGDGGNDIEMLEHAGIGVAMGNASDVVKEHADFVTKHVDDGGVAFALEHFMV